MNRGTLYSGAVFDLDAGAVAIALPDAHGRFISMQVIDEDEYTDEVDYKPGGHIFTKLALGPLCPCGFRSSPLEIFRSRKTSSI